MNNKKRKVDLVSISTLILSCIGLTFIVMSEVMDDDKWLYGIFGLCSVVMFVSIVNLVLEWILKK